MQKVLIALLVLGAGAFAFYLMGGNDSGLPAGAIPDDASVEEMEQALEEDGPRTIVGSCNAIAEKSSCVDYIGSFWGDENLAELNCDGVGTYSTTACPYSEFGGCQSAPGTVMEMVVWAYREGPGGYDEESVPYATGVCNATPNAAWILPEALGI